MRLALTAVGVMLMVVCGSGQERSRDTMPVPIREVRPEYTEAAKAAGIRGVVWLEAVVEADGDVTNITIARSLDATYGLDEEAIRALRQWRFRAGTRDGKPVARTITVEMSFTLK